MFSVSLRRVPLIRRLLFRFLYVKVIFDNENGLEEGSKLLLKLHLCVELPYIERT